MGVEEADAEAGRGKGGEREADRGRGCLAEPRDEEGRGLDAGGDCRGEKRGVRN